MRVVVVGAGMAGLTAARRIADAGHDVSVIDKGRRSGGRMATKPLAGGACADHGAQFFTVRTDAFAAAVATWIADGTVHEWCRGFSSADGHPRYVASAGMVELGRRLAVGLDVRQSVHVDAVRRTRGGWEVTWPETRWTQAGALEADVVVLTPPGPQASALVAGEADAPGLIYAPMISLLVALDDAPGVPPPGGVQLVDDPTWSWIGDNVAKGVSPVPAVTFHTRADVAVARAGEEDEALTADLLRAASPWLGRSNVLDARLHRWRYATAIDAHPERCAVEADGSLVFAGDGYGGARIEGAFLSGRAAAEAIGERTR